LEITLSLITFCFVGFENCEMISMCIALSRAFKYEKESDKPHNLGVLHLITSQTHNIDFLFEISDYFHNIDCLFEIGNYFYNLVFLFGIGGIVSSFLWNFMEQISYLNWC
jgi:hypothetical protein